jgi:hypothetical protein
VVSTDVAEEDDAGIVAGGAEIGTRLSAKQRRYTPGLNSGVGVCVYVGVEVIKGGRGDGTIGRSGLSYRTHTCQEKLTVPQLIRIFPEYYETRWFVFAPTSAQHLSF